MMRLRLWHELTKDIGCLRIEYSAHDQWVESSGEGATSDRESEDQRTKSPKMVQVQPAETHAGTVMSLESTSAQVLNSSGSTSGSDVSTSYPMTPPASKAMIELDI